MLIRFPCLLLASLAVVACLANAAAAQSPVPWPRAATKLVGPWSGKAVKPDESLTALSRDDGFVSPAEKVLALAEKLEITLVLKPNKTGEIAITQAGSPLTPRKIIWSVQPLTASDEEFDLALTTVGEEGKETRTIRFSPYDENTFIGSELGGDYRMPAFRFTRGK